MRKIDYWVEVDGDDTTGEFAYNIRSALAKAKKMAKEYSKEVFIQKYKYDEHWDDMLPADFDTPSYWIVEPNGKINEH